jgi:hypothetical protein
MGWREARSLLRTHTRVTTRHHANVVDWAPRILAPLEINMPQRRFQLIPIQNSQSSSHIFTLEPLLRSLLNRVQMCDISPSSFVKTMNKYHINAPTSGGTGNSCGHNHGVHSHPKSKSSSHKHVLWIPTVPRHIIYDLRSSHFVMRKWPQAHNG